MQRQATVCTPCLVGSQLYCMSHSLTLVFCIHSAGTYYIDQDTCMRICGPELLESVLWAVTYVDVITAPIIAPQGIGPLLAEWN